MRAHTLVTALLAASLLTVGLVQASRSAHQDDDSKPQRRTLADMSQAERAQAQAKALQLASPGPEHAFLAKYAGTFDTETTLWPQPGAAPIVVKGTAEHELVLGGRFLSVSSETVYEFPGMGKYEVEALQFLGFDRRSGRYTSIGFDTMGTYSVSAEGSYDAASKTMTLSGVDEDVSLGLTQVYDFVVEFVDEDTMKSSIVFHDMFEPGAFKMLELVSRRRKE